MSSDQEDTVEIIRDDLRDLHSLLASGNYYELMREAASLWLAQQRPAARFASVMVDMGDGVPMERHVIAAPLSEPLECEALPAAS